MKSGDVSRAKISSHATRDGCGGNDNDRDDDVEEIDARADASSLLQCLVKIFVTRPGHSVARESRAGVEARFSSRAVPRVHHSVLDTPFFLLHRLRAPFCSPAFSSVGRRLGEELSSSSVCLGDPERERRDRPVRARLLRQQAPQEPKTNKQGADSGPAQPKHKFTATAAAPIYGEREIEKERERERPELPKAQQTIGEPRLLLKQKHGGRYVDRFVASRALTRCAHALSLYPSPSRSTRQASNCNLNLPKCNNAMVNA